MDKFQVHRLILVTKARKVTQSKKKYPNHTNEKLLEVQEGAGFTISCLPLTIS